MRVLALSSAGKDSTLSLDWALHKGWEVAAIVTVLARPGSWMFQHPCVDVARLHAESLGVRWVPVEVQDEFDDLSALERVLNHEVALAKDDGHHIGGIVSGAIASDYQKVRIDRIGARLGIPTFSPLWHHEPESHLRAVCDAGLDVRIIHTAADGLDALWIGVQIDDNSLARLQEVALTHQIRIDGEGGEFETTVLNAPWMERALTLDGTTSSTSSTSTFESTSVTWSENATLMDSARPSTTDY